MVAILRHTPAQLLSHARLPNYWCPHVTAPRLTFVCEPGSYGRELYIQCCVAVSCRLLVRMATPGDRDLFDLTLESDTDTDFSSDDEEVPELTEEESGFYKIVTGSRLHKKEQKPTRLWKQGDHLYSYEKTNKKIHTSTGFKCAIKLKCRNYRQNGCPARATVSELDKLFLNPGSSHTCSGGGEEKHQGPKLGICIYFLYIPMFLINYNI